MARHRKPTRRTRLYIAVVAIVALVFSTAGACDAAPAVQPELKPTDWHDTGVQWSQWACFGHLLLIKSGGYHENVVTPAVADPDHLCGPK